MNAFLKLMLKGSAVSAMALTLAAVGCSDSDKETKPGAGGESGGGKAGSATTGGSSSDAGSTNGGDPGTEGGTGGVAGGAGPTDGGAAGADVGGAGGAGGAGGVSVARFCNNLTFGTDADPMDTTLVLEIGTGASKVTLTATTGECGPIDGAACASIPLGPEVPVALFDADDLTMALYEGVIDSADGDNWVFYSDLSAGAEPSPIAAGGVVDDKTCDEYTYDDVYN
jgi:hypothetical protein